MIDYGNQPKKAATAYSSKIRQPQQEDDLRQNYQNALECLVHCEAIINSLQGSLVAKDQRIATLEDKIVQMSFELASSKAFEDEHRSRRRVSQQDEDEEEFVEYFNQSAPAGLNCHRNIVPKSIISPYKPIKQSMKQKRSLRSFALSFSSLSSETASMSLDDSDTSGENPSGNDGSSTKVRSFIRSRRATTATLDE